MVGDETTGTRFPDYPRGVSCEENNQFRIWRECSNGASSGIIEEIDLNDESFPNL